MLNERDILTRSTAKWRTSHKSGRVREEMVRPQERTRRRIFRVWGFVAWANAPPRHSSPRRVPVLPTRTHDGVCLRWYGVGGEPLGSSGERCARAPAGECMTPRRTRPIRTGVYRLASLFSRRRRRFAAGARREATRASRGTDARRAARQRRGLHCVKPALARTSHGVAARNAGTRAAYHPTILADLYPHSVPSSQVRAPVRAPFAVKAEAVRTHPRDAPAYSLISRATKRRG